ncbi:DUF4870 domain-containing protein [Angustibacter aerolatus]|uniref:DUF4870 domain-containing protein n=1 Tax=Angustibacter aerolatus TaxID=1162965 RepID=A0ABQ6JFT5_9ACTN|nr:DUF4870 domain-containing protein [Angustibacter aerolatus]GMA85641.1 hypothetical protein GCM10025868_08910 [Angustibacter aerolatus]
MTDHQPEPGPSLSKEPSAQVPPQGAAPQAGYQQQQGGYQQPAGYQQPGQPYPAPGAGQAPLSPAEDRQWAMLGHLGAIILGIVSPLIVWLVFKDRSRFVDDQGKEALNFQITVLIAWVAASVLAAVAIGFALYPIIWIGNLVLCIMAGLAANKGEAYRYPFALRLVK